VKFWCSK